MDGGGLWKVARRWGREQTQNFLKQTPANLFKCLCCYYFDACRFEAVKHLAVFAWSALGCVDDRGDGAGIVPV